MPLTAEQIAAGRAVKRALERAEEAHPNSGHVRNIHRALAALRDSFRNDMPGEDFVAFGGGTPKDNAPGDDG